MRRPQHLPPLFKRFRQRRHRVQNDAGERHESSYDYDKDHKDSRPVRDVPPVVKSLHYVHGQCNTNANAYQPRHSEGKQGLLKLDVAQHPSEHLDAVGDGMCRGVSHVVPDADVHLLDPQSGLRCVHKHLAVDRQLVRVKRKGASGFHRECAKTALRISHINVTTEPETRNLVKNDLSESAVAGGLPTVPTQITAAIDDIGFIELQRLHELRNVIGVVLSIAVENDKNINAASCRVLKKVA